MAAITTAQAGNWSATGTWTGGVVPGIGDTVTLNHAVTVDDARTIGTSPSDETTNVITIASGIVLDIADNVTFQVRGNVNGNNGNGTSIRLGEGSVLLLDASNATTTSTTYKILMGVLVGNGVTGNRSTVQSDAGGGNAYFTNNGSQNGQGRFQCFFVDFKSIGDSTNPAFDVRVTAGGFGDKFEDCVFDADCGMITGSTIQTDRIIRFRRNAFLQTGPTNPFSFVCSSGTPTNDHILEGNFFRKRVLLTGFREWQTFKDNVFADGWTAASHGDYVGSAANNLFHGSQEISISGDILDWYLINTTTNNPHFCNLTNSRDVTVDGIIFEHTGSDSNGDCILAGSPGSARVYTVKRPIVLRNAGGSQSGTLLSSLGNANNTYALEHATCFVSGSNGGVQVGETYNTHAGFFSKFKDSIFYNPSGPAGFKIRNQDGGGGPTTDVVTAANADNNCGFGLDAGEELKGYDTPMTGTPGANDVDEDPDFFDEDRDAADWNLSLGGLGTIADMLDEFAKISSAGFDSNYTVANLTAFIKAGLAPTNANLAGAASDSGDIGAVAVLPAVSVNAPDGVKIGDSGTANVIVAPSEADGVDIGDTGTMVGTFTPAQTDGVDVGDTGTMIATFPQTQSEGAVIGDSAIVALIKTVAGTDGFKIGDSAPAPAIRHHSTLVIRGP